MRCFVDSKQGRRRCLRIMSRQLTPPRARLHRGSLEEVPRNNPLTTHGPRLTDLFGGCLAATNENSRAASSGKSFTHVSSSSKPRMPVDHARRTVVIRMTLLTTGRLFWHCGDHTAKPCDNQNLLFSVARGGVWRMPVDMVVCGANARAWLLEYTVVRRGILRNLVLHCISTGRDDVLAAVSRWAIAPSSVSNVVRTVRIRVSCWLPAVSFDAAGVCDCRHRCKHATA